MMSNRFSKREVAAQTELRPGPWEQGLAPRTRRTQLEIIVELLQVASHGASKTALVYRSNLNFVMIQKYLRLLQRKGLLELFQTDGGSLYRTTAKGAEAAKAISGALGLVSEEEATL